MILSIHHSLTSKKRVLPVWMVFFESHIPDSMFSRLSYQHPSDIPFIPSVVYIQRNPSRSRSCSLRCDMTLIEYDGDRGGGLEVADTELTGVWLRFEAPFFRFSFFPRGPSVTRP